jgi:hypothetical protein
MERAAEVGGIETSFKAWAERLAALTPSNPRLLQQMSSTRTPRRSA